MSAVASVNLPSSHFNLRPIFEFGSDPSNCPILLSALKSMTGLHFNSIDLLEEIVTAEDSYMLGVIRIQCKLSEQEMDAVKALIKKRLGANIGLPENSKKLQMVREERPGFVDQSNKDPKKDKKERKDKKEKKDKKDKEEK